MLSGDNGILQKATTAKENTDNSQIQERINLAYHSSLVDGEGKVTEESLESELKKEFNKTTLDEGWLDKTSVEGKWKITIDDVSLNVPAGKETPPEPITLPVGTYTAGQEVTCGGEQFFVIADDGNSVRLLAKYCLSKTENKQLTRDATTSDYGITFSNTKYWSSINGITYPYNLQSTEGLTQLANTNEENVNNNAILKAQEYGTSKGLTGRLMTKEEADAIYNGSDNTMKNILFGRWDVETSPINGYLKFWIGYSQYADWIQYVDGTQSNPRNGKYGDATYGWYSNRGSSSFNCSRIIKYELN